MNIVDRVVRKEIRETHRIKDTCEERFTYLRLDKNERIVPFTESEIATLRQRITSDSISGYAELGALYRRLADTFSLSADEILLTAGSDLAIKTVYETCIEKGSNVVLHLPCFGMYRVYARMFGADARTVPLDANWQPDIPAMHALVDDCTRMVVVENPNGFVGTEPDSEALVRLADTLHKRGVLLLIDEAYRFVEYSESSAIRLMREYPNVIIAQTFSKAHGLAGVRFGCLIARREMMEYFQRVRPMHEVSSLAAVAAEWVLDHPEMLARYRTEIAKSKELLKTRLTKIGIRWRDTHANFILAYFPDEGPTAQIASRLRERGILIRRPFEEPFLKGWTRITVGACADMERFTRTLGEVVGAGAQCTTQETTA